MTQDNVPVGLLYVTINLGETPGIYKISPETYLLETKGNKIVKTGEAKFVTSTVKKLADEPKGKVN